MPRLTLPDGAVLHYRDEYWGHPWQAEHAETVMLVHGVAETAEAWYGWLPNLVTDYRVIRPDLPGFGQSAVPETTSRTWSVEELANDVLRLIDALGLARVHLIGAKYGGSIAIRVAADRPNRIATLSVVGGPVAMKERTRGIDLARYSAEIEALGVKEWAARSMRDRLGSGASEEQRAWWTNYMGAADQRATAACSRAAGALDLADELAQIHVPSLFITTRGSPLLPVDDYAAVVSRLPGAELLILEDDGYHPAATHPAEAAAAVRSHVAAHPAQAAPLNRLK